MRKKPRVLCTKKLVKHIAETTGSCYLKAKESITLSPKYRKFAYDLSNEVDVEYYLITEFKENIDIAYLDELIKLPSDTLQDILFVHEKGRIRRASRTIEHIISELARRQLIDDSSESIS